MLAIIAGVQSAFPLICIVVAQVANCVCVCVCVFVYHWLCSKIKLFMNQVSTDYISLEFSLDQCVWFKLEWL